MKYGIKLLAEIEGVGEPIVDSQSFSGVLKFYRNRGEPLEMARVVQEPIPYVTEVDGELTIRLE